MLQYLFGREPEVMHCLSQLGGGAGCGPATATSGPDSGRILSVANHVADYDLWTWTNLPAETAYVTYDAADQHLWQRPVAGTVAFPYVRGRDHRVGHAPDGTWSTSSDGERHRRVNTTTEGHSPNSRGRHR